MRALIKRNWYHQETHKERKLLQARKVIAIKLSRRLRGPGSQLQQLEIKLFQEIALNPHLS